MQINVIKALSDNYIWTIEDGKEAMLVDPGEAKPALAYLKEKELQLTTILLTHKHEDHIGGVLALCDAYPEVRIYGPKEISSFPYECLSDGASFEVGAHHFAVRKTAGHTEEHISLLMDEEHLFCGDALFSAGCGRVFTGDYEAAYQGMQVFKSLPPEVLIYAGHEYTLTNLKFALDQCPNDLAIKDAYLSAQAKQQADIPTLPSPLATEFQINLFLQAKNVQEFKALRDKRDRY